MTKSIWKPATLLNPVPVVMVTCGDGKGNDNIITVAWAGTVNSEPPMLSVSIRKERHSYNLIKESGAFCVNLVTKKLTYCADYCGVKSGAKVDKFLDLHLTKEKASTINIPIIKESPINIECTVKDIIPLGSHDLFIGLVTAINVEDSLIDNKGKLRLNEAGLVCYCHGEYVGLKETLGFFGFSVAKKKIRR